MQVLPRILLVAAAIAASATKAGFDCSSMTPGTYTMTIKGLSGADSSKVTLTVQIT